MSSLVAPVHYDVIRHSSSSTAGSNTSSSSSSSTSTAATEVSLWTVDARYLSSPHAKPLATTTSSRVPPSSGSPSLLSSVVFMNADSPPSSLSKARFIIDVGSLSVGGGNRGVDTLADEINKSVGVIVDCCEVLGVSAGHLKEVKFPVEKDSPKCR